LASGRRGGDEKMSAEQNLVVHFGAGALGRGFIVPILKESGMKVCLVDSNHEIIRLLKQDNAYCLNVSDEVPERQMQEIKIDSVFQSVDDSEDLMDALKRARVVTTSVRKENLVHIAGALAKAWQDGINDDRIVICCENIEHVSAFFRNLLQEAAENEDARRNLMNIKIPDVMVDRGCAQDPEDPLTVQVKRFYEIAVDKKELPDTGIRLIPSVDNMETCFYRKRFLLNTYVDALSFIALDKGLITLYDAIHDKELTARMDPYMTAVKESLVLGWGMSSVEVEHWDQLYRDRNLNSAGNKRTLESIARDMWRKLEYEERFVKPLAVAAEYGVDIGEASKFLADLVSIEIKRNEMDRNVALEQLKQMWQDGKSGKEVFTQVEKYLKISE